MSKALKLAKLDKRECTYCNKKFEPKVKESREDANITIVYTKCTKCDTVYTLSVINQQTLEIDNQLQDIREKTFAPNSTLTPQQKRKNVTKIQLLNLEKGRLVKELTKVHRHRFMQYGERVITGGTF